MIKKVLSAAMLAMTFSGSVLAASQADFDQAYAAAEQARKAAATMRNEWRDTGKLLKQAKKTAKAGDFDKAIKLAKAAEFQGKMAVQQAKANANVGNPDYLYN